MRYLQAEHKEWDDFRNQVEQGEASAGIVLIEGSSEAVSRQVQVFLQRISQKGETFQYFLSSGREHFRVPCYMAFAEDEIMSEPVRHFHLLREQYTSNGQPASVVNGLEQRMADEARMPRFIAIECLTPPGQHDLRFISLLLHSHLPRLVPVIIFVHRYCHENRSLFERDAVSEILSLLYICGGRVRAVDWTRLTGIPCEHLVDLHLFSSRCIASETWICYAHRGIAEGARDLYRALGQDQRVKIARHALSALPNNSGYPLLSIAAETDSLEAMQSKYSLSAVDVALVEPECVVNYFERLHRLAQDGGDDSLVRLAYICYLAARIYVDHRVQAPQVYQIVREMGPVHGEQKIEADFWIFLGQRLAVMNIPEAWTYATDCLGRSHAIYDEMYRTGKIKELQWTFNLAISAKIEGLIAYKLRQGEQTRRIMEFAVSGLAPIGSSLSLLIDARVNFGDALLRLLGDTASAIVQYQEALLAFMSAPEERKSRLRLDGWSELRPAQKLGEALVLERRYEEAIQIFDMLLIRLKNLPARDGKQLAQLTLKARLALAGVYLKSDCPRSAAACYWLILRQPDWLEPEELQETAAKLRVLRPNMHTRLQQRIDTVITTQKNMKLDVMAVQRVLSEL
ncbi:MAG TPA: hypothetical protein VFV38_20310 [Ktedonobacteraceae bacterium]|nr:hypothetical protein [Ktedonobacteraceae bacterium]